MTLLTDLGIFFDVADDRLGRCALRENRRLILIQNGAGPDA